MRLLLEIESTRRWVDIGADPTTPVAELADELGVSTLYVNGSRVGPSSPVGDVLHVGAHVSDRALDEEGDGPGLIVVTGVDAGRLLVPTGRSTVGRFADLRVDHPTVSRVHCEIEVVGRSIAVRDLGSRNGTEVDGAFVRARTVLSDQSFVRLGAVIATTRPPVMRRNVIGSFNRPPRDPQTDAPRPPAAPASPHTTAATPLNVMRLLVPLGMGLSMAVMFHPRMALFALMSPLMMLGTWLANRRRARRDNTLSVRAFRSALERFATEAEHAHRAETHRRRSSHPDIATVVARAREIAPQLWERRSDSIDFAELNAGPTSMRWSGGLDEDDPQECRDVIERLGPLSNVPCVVDAKLPIGVVGAPTIRAAIARSLVVQMAVHHGPADVELSVLDHDPEAWLWVGGLPHCRKASEGARIASSENEIALSHAEDTILQWVVVTEAEIVTGPGSALRAALQAPDLPVSGLILADSIDALPSCCATIIDAGDETTGRVLRSGQVDEILVAGLSRRRSENVACALGGLVDPDRPATDAGVPRVCRLLPLVGLDNIDDIDPDNIRARWADATHARSLRVRLGEGAADAVEIDLVADGPHGLIAGTTGSGKSELLRTIVAGLAADYSPAQVNVVLVDYKGGAAFDLCARLPHAVGLVTDLDEGLAARALRCLEAELIHRESVLRLAGADDIASFIDDDGEELARLVVVIDEFAALAKELPDFMDALVDIAQRGRSLGVHLLLATQRPSGVLKENIKTNTNLRIALRLLDKADSKDVIGTDAAASLARSTPGRALARVGPGEIVAFQTAQVSGIATERAGRAPMVRSPLVVADSGLDAPAAGNVPDAAGPAEATDLERLVVATRRAWSGPAPRRPWPDPLPDAVLPEDVELPADANEDDLVIGLCDEPARQRRRPFTWNPGSGSLLLAGTSGSGISSALCAVALAAAEQSRPDDLHVYGIDFGNGGLGPLGPLPHCGAIIGASEIDRVVRLVELLARTMRLRATGSAGVVSPRMLCLVENWTGLANHFDGYRSAPVLDALTELLVDGPRVGISIVAAANRPQAFAPALLASTPNRLALRLADPADHGTMAQRSGINQSMVPGRCIDSTTGLECSSSTTPTSRRLSIALPKPGIARPIRSRHFRIVCRIRTSRCSPPCAANQRPALRSRSTSPSTVKHSWQPASSSTTVSTRRSWVRAVPDARLRSPPSQPPPARSATPSWSARADRHCAPFFPISTTPNPEKRRTSQCPCPKAPDRLCSSSTTQSSATTATGLSLSS